MDTINKSKELLDRIRYEVDTSKVLKEYSDKIVSETERIVKRSRRQLDNEERD